MHGYTCPSGYTLSGSTCYSTSSVGATPVYQCPAGYTLSGTTCSAPASAPATLVRSCPQGFIYSAGTQTCDYGWTAAQCQSAWLGMSLLSYEVTGRETDLYYCRYTPYISYSCPAGQTFSGTTCNYTNTQAASIAYYSCPSGYFLSGTTCSLTTSVAGTPTYACAPGTTLSGSNCISTATLPVFAAHEAASTSSFVYGPEHQRIRRTVAFSGAGAKAAEPGSTWYLNGQDSLGLTYEREVRDNGTTEHRHFVSAGGTTFALFVSRTGNLNGQAANATSYLHHDQLGSTAAVTNEAGAVVERLAYDPWGKRRFIATSPGKDDELDLIAGNRTDRGYTMHEHLDEMGWVHMNARIQDPHLGRFITPDPIVQAPYNTKSFNRYSYVWNNPLRMWDPSGFEAKDAPSSGSAEDSSTSASENDPMTGSIEVAQASWGSRAGRLNPGMAPSPIPGYDVEKDMPAQRNRTLAERIAEYLSNLISEIFSISQSNDKKDDLNIDPAAKYGAISTSASPPPPDDQEKKTKEQVRQEKIDAVLKDKKLPTDGEFQFQPPKN